jgi:acetylornithine deacetylase/succinyl-diaminopimelate desuccinylase-like protein
MYKKNDKCDLAINHRTLPEEGYKTLLELLEAHSHSYERGKQPFTFLRNVPVGGKDIEVKVDFLAGY